MNYEIKRLSVWSVAKISFVIGAVVGFIFGMFAWMFAGLLSQVALDEYVNVLAWLGRIQALPGYVGMVGIEPPGNP